jgi:hypothetical protein
LERRDICSTTTERRLTFLATDGAERFARVGGYFMHHALSRPTSRSWTSMPALLAVDAGVRTGLALLDRDGRLVWCRSHNLGNTARLKKAAARCFMSCPRWSIW